MPSDEEGNKNQEGKKGIKRKSVESAEESANKQLCFSASTSTGITHDDQAKGNVGKINWMKCCDVDSGPVPRCIICENRYELHIDPTTLENHLNEKHPRDIRENESPDWIFNYYRPISALHIRCNLSGCKQKLEVAKFKGQFVDHFNRKHEEEAEKRFQGDNEDPEEVKKRLTKKFVFYLYTAFKNKGNGNVGKINWIVLCVINDTRTKLQCSNCPKNYSLYIESSPFKDHFGKENHPEIDTEENESEWIFRYFDPVENSQHLKCKICEGTVEVLELKGQFVDHVINSGFHSAIAKLKSNHVDPEELKQRMINCILYLYEAFKNKDTIEDNENKKSEEGTSSKKQDKQAEGNVRKIPNWMKCCKISDSSSARPKCRICQTHDSLYIDSESFKNHLNYKHGKLIEVENLQPDWIFRYYTPSEFNPQKFRCKVGGCFIEFSGFSGPFVQHFDSEEHKRKAERRNEGDVEDVQDVEDVEEDVKENESELANRFINCLYYAYREKAIHDVRYKAWWMDHVKLKEEGLLDNSVSCDVTGCPEPRKTYRVYFDRFNFNDHYKSHHPEVQLRRGRNLPDYILFDDYLLRCRSCDEILTYSLRTPFKTHLSKIHEITSPLLIKDKDPLKTIEKIDKDEAIIQYDIQLIEILMKSYILLHN